MRFTKVRLAYSTSTALKDGVTMYRATSDCGHLSGKLIWQTPERKWFVSGIDTGGLGFDTRRDAATHALLVAWSKPVT